MKDKFHFVIKLITGRDPKSHYIEINPFEWFLWFTFRQTTPISNVGTRSIYIVTKFVDESPMMDTGCFVNSSWIRNATLNILCFKICWTRRYYQPLLRRVYGVNYDHATDSRERQKMRSEILVKLEYWTD